jgi:hypothetical protein
MKQVVLIGEIRIGDGVVHQKDFAAALDAERLVGWPKNFEDVEFIVGKLLAGRKPAMLHRAEKKGIEAVTVESVMTPEVTTKLVQLLEAKSKLESYETRALLSLKATAATQAPPEQKSGPDTTLLANLFPMPPTRGKGKKKGAANA